MQWIVLVQVKRIGSSFRRGEPGDNKSMIVSLDARGKNCSLQRHAVYVEKQRARFDRRLSIRT